MESKIYELKIGQCENQAEYEALVQEHQSLYAGWREHILPMLQAHRLTAKKIAEGCQISEGSARTFSRKIPSKRENVIMLAMMMHLNVSETDELLMRWAKFQKLYAKNPEDAIWIYLLEKGGSEVPALRFDEYYREFQRLHSAYLQISEDQFSRDACLDTQIALDEILVHAKETSTAAKSELPAQEDAAFQQMVKELLPAFEQGYQKLIDYIHAHFLDPETIEDVRVGLTELAPNSVPKRVTPNLLFEGKRGCLERYYRKMRELEQKRNLPSRTFLIALGLHLSMNTDQINTMLELAGMGPLCPKDRLEGSIVFYLEELYCQFPTLFHPYSLDVDPAYQNLQVYSSGQGVKPEIQLDFDDIPTESLSDYIKRRLEETNIFDPDDTRAVEAFLELL